MKSVPFFIVTCCVEDGVGSSEVVYAVFAVAVVTMVINEACCLEECIADSRTKEFETATFHVRADCI